jgi:hypothetical protein
LKGWTTPQIVLFLEKCMVLSPESKMPVTVLDKMDSLYSLTASRNSEVRQSVQCAANNHASCTLCQPCTMHPLPTMHHAPSANHASCTLCQPCIMHPLPTMHHAPLCQPYTHRIFVSPRSASDGRRSASVLVARRSCHMSSLSSRSRAA